jgi:hypothetical protein
MKEREELEEIERGEKKKEKKERKKESASDRWTDGQIYRCIVVDRQTERKKER